MRYLLSAMVLTVALLFTGQTASGQCYYGPPVYYQPQVVCGEHHIYRNTGHVHQSFYKAIRLPSGQRTSIRVINGYLPKIYVYNNGHTLVLDYKYKYAYDQYGSGKSYVQYHADNGRGSNSQAPAPAPRNPNFDRGEQPAPPEKPAPKPEDKAPAPRNPNLERGEEAPAPQNPNHGEQEKPQVAPMPKAPSPRRPSDEDIDKALDNLSATHGGKETDDLYRGGALLTDEFAYRATGRRFDRKWTPEPIVVERQVQETRSFEDGLRRPSEVEGDGTVFPRYK